MWMTGSDTPKSDTMCVEKPMVSHGRMQAIAHVDLTFKGKPGGFLVDYLGLPDAVEFESKHRR